MKTKFFDIAKKASNNGEHRYQVGAALIKKNKVVSTGFNRQKTHPKSPSPFKHIHAEVDCILGLSEELVEGSEIYVYRETRNNTLGMSKPCVHCEWFLRLRKVSKVHYTTEEGLKTYVL